MEEFEKIEELVRVTGSSFEEARMNIGIVLVNNIIRQKS